MERECAMGRERVKCRRKKERGRRSPERLMAIVSLATSCSTLLPPTEIYTFFLQLGDRPSVDTMIAIMGL